MNSRTFVSLLAAALACTAIAAPANADDYWQIKNKPRGASADAGGDSSFVVRNRERSSSRSFDFFNLNRDFFGRDTRKRGTFDSETSRNTRVRVRLSGSGDDGPDIDVPSQQYYTYKPDPLVALKRAGLKQAAATGPAFGSDSSTPQAAADIAPGEMPASQAIAAINQAIHAALRDGTTPVRLTQAEADAVVAFYAERRFEPIWIAADAPSSRAGAVLDVLRSAEIEGLDPSDYALPSLPGARTLSSLPADPAALAGFEIELTAMALRYAGHASGGRVDPNRISGYHDLRPPRVAPADALSSLANHSSPAYWLSGLHPRISAYLAMRKELERRGARTRTAEDIVIPSGPLIREGSVDERLPLIRKRLVQLDFLKDNSKLAANLVIGENGPSFGSETAEAALAAQTLTMSAADAEAVRAFQSSAGLTADGLIGNRTVAALNGETPTDRVAQIALNMERLRWLPRDLGARYIMVNQAAFELRIMSGDTQEWSTRVIVGKPNNQTFFFSDEMERVEFNPYWGIPQSIIVNEYLKRLRGNPSYLDQRGYEVVNAKGRVVSSSSVDWWNYSLSRPVAVRQKPGPRNALGEVKFMFPNTHAIYLHDTPSKPLFNNAQRAYSHGCVRVQNPRELAEHILGWPQSRIASTIATGKNTPVQLSRKLPVHLTYFTAWPDAGGTLAFYGDVYQRDDYLSRAVAAVRTTYR